MTYEEKVNVTTKVKELIKLQVGFNNDTNGKVWLEGITKDGRPIDWNLCMIQEAGEAIDSLVWKHWKDIDGKDDMDNFKMELTDVLHFLISESIIKDVDCDIDVIIVSTKSLRDNVKYNRDGLIRNIKTFIKHVLLAEDDFTGINFKMAMKLFFELVESTPDFSFEDMYNMYLSKNILNVFRQANGYNEGTYIKVFGGKEDNVWLMDYVNSNENVTKDSIMEYMTEVYAENTKK